MKSFTALLFAALSLAACREEGKPGPVEMTEQFRTYWMKGVAEISSYRLTQARYGKLHEGRLILIMVTEPFKLDRQVKSELNPTAADPVILKAHEQRHFTTGIYDYTMTTSSFMPLNPEEGVLKITGTSAEWCGHTFFQLNRQQERFRVLSRSYFEAEGDQEYEVAGVLSEDEIYQRIRLSPARLPRGEIQVLPSVVSARLRHKSVKPVSARAELAAYDGPLSQQKNLEAYRLTYDGGQQDERQVTYVFEKEFPHRIVALSDEYLDGFQQPVRLQTTAVLTSQIQIDYWKKHDPEHEALRKTLDL
ncbi:MAG: hypothetical protein HS115_18025 [Spirochaetales bacterium]|nr:hypothetical protein [Spirochaetales bacterium]